MKFLMTSENTVAAVAIVALLVLCAAPVAKWLWVRFRKQGLAFALIAMGFLYAAATKPSRFSFEDGIADNGSYSSNSTVYVAWTVTSIIPSAARLYIEYKDRSNTNDVYHALADTAIASRSWRTDAFANATNYDYNVWYEYTPVSPVHTNGVWEYSTMKTRDNRSVLPVRAAVMGDSTTISPPKQGNQNE